MTGEEEVGQDPWRSEGVRAEVKGGLIVDHLSEGPPRRLGPAHVEPSHPSTLQEGGLHLIHPIDSLREEGLELKQLRGEHKEPFPQE